MLSSRRWSGIRLSLSVSISLLLLSTHTQGLSIPVNLAGLDLGLGSDLVNAPTPSSLPAVPVGVPPAPATTAAPVAPSPNAATYETPAPESTSSAVMSAAPSPSAAPPPPPPPPPPSATPPPPSSSPAATGTVAPTPSPSPSAQINGCYPALDFQHPAGNPTMNATEWWCDQSTEQGFFGFSYDVGACKSLKTMQADFGRMRSQFNARYVRLYSACDEQGFMDNVITAAYGAGIGVYSLIWFGFDGGKQWMTRRDSLIQTIKTNPLASYVIRSIDVGSEPLFDWVLTPQQLAEQINYVRVQTMDYGITVASSEMQYGYTVQGNSQAVLDAIDVVHAHELPFFDKNAKTGSEAGASVLSSTGWFVKNTNGSKKVIFTQTGWPTNTNVWKANSKTAVASVTSSAAYLATLDGLCEQLKSLTGHGGVGWFWQIWSDEDLDGWGLIDHKGNPKFEFAPRTSC